MSEPEIVPAGDQALRIMFKNTIDSEINHKVMVLDERLSQMKIIGIEETIPAFRTLTVFYNGIKIDYQTLSEMIKPLLSDLNQSGRKNKRIIEIPVCYDEQFGIDLKDVAKHANLTVDEVIRLHSERDYLIYMLGFLPGFAYLGEMNPLLTMPRLESPRLKINEGAVGIAGKQTGIYPMDSPGGWRIIGSTPVRLFDLKRELPVLYKAGDYIRFKPVSLKEYEKISKQSYRNEYRIIVTMEDDGFGDSDSK